MTGKELQEFLRRSYSRMDYPNLCAFYDNDRLPHYFTDVFLEEKWKKFNSNFLAWFCELPENDADRFIQFVRNLY